VRAASASDQTALMNDRAFKCHRCSKVTVVTSAL
jgi:hypothetical protein